MKSNKFTEEELEQLKRIQEEKNQEVLKQFILDKTESNINNKFSDEELDKELEKRKLLDSIADLWKIKNIGTNVLKEPIEHDTIFTQDYYKEIYRLKEWKYEGNISKKPWIVGRYTNEIIYYRFAAEVLPFLRIINPYIIYGKRQYKHHQYLTSGARIKLTRFISEAVEEMKKCGDWNEFRIKYCKKYNVPYQLNLFLPSEYD